MSKNVKTFLSIFLFITAAVGLVLLILNLLASPPSVPTGIVFGVVGVAALVGGVLLNRRERW
ncbi:hypothetical protein [Dermabacter sp. Marseille-Q3180]|uniref:hypothetical protein n=1 Tax=Dermabacter sp. Marseille-Q3180 TaxID=2758090 RepID=UPI0020255774|nr:hypothetical protein [Dermabacter sp. Marseille-Q3180]